MNSATLLRKSPTKRIGSSLPVGLAFAQPRSMPPTRDVFAEECALFGVDTGEEREDFALAGRENRGLVAARETRSFSLARSMLVSYCLP